jgi:hypothetical protein
MSKEGCIVPRCRGSADINYKGRYICADCWELYCSGNARVIRAITENHKK